MNRILLLLIFLLYHIIGSSQVPDYFGQSQKWMGGFSESVVENMGHYNSQYSLFVVGDTIVNNKGYYKVYGNGNHTYYEYGQMISGGSADTSLRYLFRQQGRKVYYFESDINGDSLWIDYGAGIGDTINGKMASNFTVWVTDIDTVELDGESHRRLWLNQYSGGASQPILIEGVGYFNDTIGLSNIGSFYAIGPEGFGVFETLHCYAKNDTTVYTRVQQSCSYNSYIEGLGLRQEKITLKVYPNPVQSLLTITSSIPSRKLEIYDLSGRRRYQDQESTQRIRRLDFSVYAPGVYIIYIFLENGRTVSRKIIKS